MKKIIAIAASLALLATACKKSGSASPWYVKASMNDSAMTFNYYPAAHLSTISGFTYINLVGSISSPQNPQHPESIALSIENTPSNKPIVAGVYTQSSTDFLVSGVYYPPASSTVEYNAGIAIGPPNPLTITITSIDKSTIKGTFSGDFFYTDISTGTYGSAKKTFTNGEFNLQIVSP